MNIYERTIRVPEEGLSTRELFWQLQEVSAAHSEALGFGGAKMEELGLMWVVVRYLVRAARWPRGGETLRLETWPGQVRHSMCPRYYRLLDADGALLLEGCCVWAVVDRQSRQMVQPQERGVGIPAVVTGLEARLPGPLRRPVTDRETTYTVPEEVLDQNGHMNNTRYFDLAERCAGLDARTRGLTEALAEFQNEALVGDRLLLRWGLAGDTLTVLGERDGEGVFRMRLSYTGEGDSERISARLQKSMEDISAGRISLRNSLTKK